MAEQTFFVPPEMEQSLLNDLQTSMRPENHVLNDLTKRRVVLQALGVPLVFASAERPFEPVATDGIMNYWLWCYFEQGVAWQNFLAIFSIETATLEEILEGYEFNAFSFQGQRHLSLYSTEHYVTHGVLSIETPEWSRRIEVRIPKGFQNILAYQTLEVFAEEVAAFKAELGEWFEEVKEEIGAWLVNHYEGINPTSRGFVQWFFANHGYIDVRIAYAPITHEYSICEVTYTQKRVEAKYEKLIHAYCEYRRIQQNKHKQEILSPRPKRALLQPAPPTLIGQPETIHHLFKNESVREKAFKALTLVEPRLINEAGEWVGRRGSKSALVAWIDVLELRGYLTKVEDRIYLSQLLINTFPRLHMDTSDGSLWRKITAAGTKSHADFLSLIP